LSSLRFNDIFKTDMANKIVSKIARQLGQIAEETVEEIKKEPKQMGEVVREQVGLEESKETKPPVEGELEEMKVKDKAKSRRLAQQIEAEIKEMVRKRQEEMEEYRTKMEALRQSKLANQEKKAPLPEVPTKPKEGLPFWGRRIKSAQQQTRPETVGRRVGG